LISVAAEKADLRRVSTLSGAVIASEMLVKPSYAKDDPACHRGFAYAPLLPQRKIDNAAIGAVANFRSETELLHYVDKQSEQAREVVVVYEAGPLGYGLYRNHRRVRSPSGPELPP